MSDLLHPGQGAARRAPWTEYLVPTALGLVAAAWYSVFGPEPAIIWVDVAMEGSYFLGALLAWGMVARGRERVLQAGWLLFVLSLELEVLDEFTLESAFWNELLPFTIGVTGLMLVAAGFWVQARRRAVEDAEQARTRSSLERSHSILQAVIEGTPDLVTVRDLDGRYVLANSAMAQAAGRPVEDLLGKTDADLFAPEVATAMADMDTRVLESGDTVTYEEVLPADDAPRTYLVSKAVFRDRRGFAVGILRVARDITERKRAEARLFHEAGHDALTGLPNRARLLEELGIAISRCRRSSAHLFAVLFLDLDRFKVVNDSLGHTVGDALLSTFARTLRGWIRPSDFVARMGGDEFVVLLDGMHELADATRVAERIEQGLRAPLLVGDREIYVAASIGIALSTTGYSAPDDVLRDADLALYRAKAAGRARYALFDVEMHERAMGQLQMETDLRHGLERGEFRIAYQPIVTVGSGRLVGFEALVRWQHPARGLLLPGEFLQVADDTGLMVPIGEWILREALAQLARWGRQFPAEASQLSMSVNVSSRQLVHPDLITTVQAALRDAGLAPARLRIEVTESVIMEHADAATERLAELRALGVLLDMDDFGTGYSSLSHLQRFPLQAVKIDRSFVDRMRGGAHAEIVRAILTLGRQLGLEVIAEGVETDEQHDALVQMGCPQAQGYLFSHPVMAEAAGAIIAGGVGALRR